ncbi:hypothetical protein ACP70R_037239 [Stipagrostis hirtigluma subsp. patula]
MTRYTLSPATATTAALLMCAVLLEPGDALHLCVDQMYNSTEGQHMDGLSHLTQTEEATWMALLTRELHGGSGTRAEFNWLAFYHSLTRGRPPGDADTPGEALSLASLHDVHLLNAGDGTSMYWQGQQSNLEYLLYLDPDRLA